MDISAVIASGAAAATVVLSAMQSRLGRKDNREDQRAANALSDRERSLDELQELQHQRKERIKELVDENQQMRTENRELRQFIRQGMTFHAGDELPGDDDEET